MLFSESWNLKKMNKTEQAIAVLIFLSTFANNYHKREIETTK